MDRSNQRKLGAALLLVLASVLGCMGSTEPPLPPSPPSPTGTSSPGATQTLRPTATPTPTLIVTGTFVATGDMTHARMGATATLLPDGKVLIAGGVDAIAVPAFEYVASAELYNPSTGTFTRTGSMKVARSSAAAILLPDGRVLIVGGDGCKDPAHCTTRDWAGETILKSAELYDPTTGRFTSAGSLTEPGDHATATLLPDGRVLVVDGYNRVVETYSAMTGKFSHEGTLSNQYQGVVTALLPNGKVRVVGDGLPGLGAELFDPSSGLSSPIPFSVPGTDPHLIQVGTAIVVKDGRVLVWAWDLHALVNYLFTYDPATDAFAEAGSFDSPAGWAPDSAVLLRDGRILFAGGAIVAKDGVGGSRDSDSAGLYDPASGFHLLDSKMTQALGGQTMTTLLDGTVLIAGGGDGDILSSAELFKP